MSTCLQSLERGERTSWASGWGRGMTPCLPLRTARDECMCSVETWTGVWWVLRQCWLLLTLPKATNAGSRNSTGSPSPSTWLQSIMIRYFQFSGNKCVVDFYIIMYILFHKVKLKLLMSVYNPQFRTLSFIQSDPMSTIHLKLATI